MNYGQAIQDELRPQSRELRRMIPDVYKGFAALHGAALVDGVLDAKTKELIALAISVNTQCDGCISAHAKAAARLGATREEAAEAIIKQRPNAKLDKKVLKDQIQLTIDFFDTPATKGKPIGYQAPEDWAKAAKLAQEAGIIKPGTDPSTYYTNELVQ